MRNENGWVTIATILERVRAWSETQTRFGIDVVYPVLDAFVADGASVLLKFDGMREPMDDRPAFMYTAGVFGESGDASACYRCDAEALDEAMAAVILGYAEHSWIPAGPRWVPSTLSHRMTDAPDRAARRRLADRARDLFGVSLATDWSGVDAMVAIVEQIKESSGVVTISMYPSESSMKGRFSLCQVTIQHGSSVVESTSARTIEKALAEAIIAYFHRP